MKNLKLVFPFLLLLILTVPVIIRLYPVGHRDGGLNIPYDAEAISGRAKAVLDSMGIDASWLKANTQFKADKVLLRRVQQQYGVERSNELIKEGLPVYYWEISWKKKQTHAYGIVKTEEEPDKVATNIVAYLRGDINIHLAPDGSLLSFNRDIADSVKLPDTDPYDARKIAGEFLRRFTVYALDSLQRPPLPELPDTTAGAHNAVPSTSPFSDMQTIEQKHRVDRVFSLSTRSPQLGDTMEVKVRMAGGMITEYSVEYQVPEKYKEHDSFSVEDMLLIIEYVILIILCVVVAFRRIRAYEMGFKTAWMIGIVAAAAFAFEVLMTTTKLLEWELLAPLLIGPVFYGGSLVLLWAIVESVGRESLPDHFVSIDLLRNGHIFHSRIGVNIIRGIAIGCAAIVIRLVLSWLINKWFPLWNQFNDDEGPILLHMPRPAFYAFNHSLYQTLYIYVFFFLFVIPLLRTRIRNGFIVITLASLIIGINNIGGVQPYAVGVVITVLASSVLVWAVFSYDFLAGYIGIFSAYLIKQSASLFLTGNPSYAAAGWFIVLFLGVLFAAGFVIIFRKNEITDFEAITPAFARHITERQRLQQEIEIARDVQMSLLPKTNPKYAHLDIASRCIPAKEVGGDYYDFIFLDGGKLGVAVGDVSGKGTQAAFFMTLTKGFLHAIVKQTNSPAEVLTQVNQLFYDNVERGVFISMLYAVIDTNGSRLTVARAGHNPVIAYKAGSNQVNYLKQSGLALGLDPTDKFSRSIQELTVQYAPGDLFVFYTDGFPEAMNKKQEEFGDERFSKLINENAHCTAGELVDCIFKEMKRFTGSAQQHDDMTIVVVKMV